MLNKIKEVLGCNKEDRPQECNVNKTDVYYEPMIVKGEFININVATPLVNHFADTEKVEKILTEQYKNSSYQYNDINYQLIYNAKIKIPRNTEVCERIEDIVGCRCKLNYEGDNLIIGASSKNKPLIIMGKKKINPIDCSFDEEYKNNKGGMKIQISYRNRSKSLVFKLYQIQFEEN